MLFFYFNAMTERKVKPEASFLALKNDLKIELRPVKLVSKYDLKNVLCV